MYIFSQTLLSATGTLFPLTNSNLIRIVENGYFIELLLNDIYVIVEHVPGVGSSSKNTMYLNNKLAGIDPNTMYLNNELAGIVGIDPPLQSSKCNTQIIVFQNFES